MKSAVTISLVPEARGGPFVFWDDLAAGCRQAKSLGFDAVAYDVPVVNDFFRQKVRRYIGPPGLLALRLVNPDRLPLSWRTNLYVHATKK